MFRPHVARGMFVVGGSRLWPDELQGLLRVGCDTDSGTDLSKRGSRFIDLDVDVGVFEQGDGGAEAADATADDGDAERVGGGVR